MASMKDHSCWADGNQALIKKARNEMFLKIDQDPSRSINQIYEEVRNSTTQTMTSQEKQSFLSVFPSFRQIQAKLYRKRQELIPPNPKRMTDLKLDLPLFQYSQEETVVKGDQDLRITLPCRLMSAMLRKLEGNDMSHVM